MENRLLDPNKLRKLHISIIVLLENWMVEEAIELAVKVWEMITPGEETDLLRCLVGAEDNLPMSEDALFELRKIALDLAEEYRNLSQLQEVES
jgi:hypothetical protein